MCIFLQNDVGYLYVEYNLKKDYLISHACYQNMTKPYILY